MEEFVLKAASIFTGNIVMSLLFYFVSAVLQIIFPPYPGDMVIASAGLLASKREFLDISGIYLILLICTIYIGTFIASAAVYNLGYSRGDKILHNKYINKFFPQNRYNNIKKWIDKYGFASIIISKFVPGIYSFVVLTNGVFKNNKTKSYISIALISLIQNSFLIFLGTSLGYNLGFIKELFIRYNHFILGAAIIFLAFYLMFKLPQLRKDK